MGFDGAFRDDYLEKALWALADDGDPTPALDLIAGTDDAARREHAVAVLGPGGVLRIEQLRDLATRQAYRPERWLLLGASLSAAALSRDDPVPWSELAGAVICAPQHRTETADVFKRACVLAPDLYAAHTRHLTGLTRRWYGSQDKVFAFARTRTAERPAGHPLHALVALAHIEGYVAGLLRGTVVGRFWRAWRYFADSKVRRETDTAADRLLSGHEEYATHPWTMTAHQAFAALYHQAGDARRARTHLELSGEHAAIWPWRYFGDPGEQFTAARTAAGM